MAELDRLSGSIEWIGLEFVERERTPRGIIETGIRYHLAGLSLSNTVTLLEDLGVERSRVAVLNWVQKADLQPADGETPDRVADDQKAIRINDQQYWLYAAVDPETNRILHSRLFPTYTIPIAREFLTELTEKPTSLKPYFSSMTPIISSVDSVERATATASSDTVSEIQSNVSLEEENIEHLRFQTVSVMSIQQLLKRGYKPTPSGGTMPKLTRPELRRSPSRRSHRSHAVRRVLRSQRRLFSRAIRRG